MRTTFDNIIDLANEYITQLEGAYLNQSVTIGSSAMIFDVYVVAPTTSITSSIMTGCTRNDANSQLIVGNNLSVADNEILTPPFRCKGLFIVSAGKFINRGTISMTARGASAAGVDIPLISDKYVAAVGGAGGARADASSSKGKEGNPGNSPASTVISCGGGGSGGAWMKGNGGAGGTGTSFSGGAGGGGGAERRSGAAGSSSGGQGGRGVGEAGNVNWGARGGAGNPIGTQNTYGQYFTHDTNGEGTGGLLVIASPALVNSGTITSEGSQGPGYTSSGYHVNQGVGGGASGGGCICFIADSFSDEGSVSAAGGAKSAGGYWDRYGQYGECHGGSGGAGTVIALSLENTPIGNLTTPIYYISAQSEYSQDVPIKNGQLLFNTDQSGLYYDWDFVRRGVGNNWEIYT